MPARPRPDVSPGLLRRRYSVPEAVMRRYRVAQQHTEYDDTGSEPASAHSASARAALPGLGPRHRDRDLMRRSALLRRLWGRALPAPATCCHRYHDGHSRSLDTSHADLRDVTPAPVPEPAPQRTAATRSSHPSPSTSSCEVLEIMVTSSSRESARLAPAPQPHTDASVNIDEYVSSVLVDSLNTLGDRLECLRGDGKLSVLEKQIKVKLQSTAVNTIVHLSPTSNHQIIFGNQEICDNPSPASSGRDRAVLRQIQKLFREELPDIGPGSTTSYRETLNLSEVDVSFQEGTRVLGTVGSGNYFARSEESAPVPRFTALPHTASMEVNTSSSDEVEFPGSGCTSFVDSLDDPTSPRTVPPLNRPQSRPSASQQADLARSAVAVLDLLPGTATESELVRPNVKSESFFIDIEDGLCDRDGAIVSVADRLPDRIKQRLHLRHQRRQLRVESAQRRRDDRSRRGPSLHRPGDPGLRRSRRAAERACAVIVQTLIDEVISKIVQDECKCAHIERGSSGNVITNDLLKKNIPKKILQSGGETSVDSCVSRKSSGHAGEPDSLHQICGKLSFMTRPALSPDNGQTRRLYQKSEIHDGNNCVEILEILEYVKDAQGSEAPASDGTPRNGKRSRIPVPSRQLRTVARPEPSPLPPRRVHMRRSSEGNAADVPRSPPARLTLLPPARDLRPRSGSVRFVRTFDVIPEERSLSVESPPEVNRPNSDPAAATRSVATSPLALAPATPLRASGGEGGCAGRRPRVRLPRAQEGGLREKKNCEDARLAPGAAPVPSRNGGDSKRFQNHGSHGKGQTKIISAKIISRGRKPAETVTSSQTRSEISTDEAHECAGEPSGDGRDSDAPECSSSGESALCPLAPRWLTTRRRRRRRDASPRAPAPPQDTQDAGEWSVTVAGSCRAALPTDVEMRLRFPRSDARSSRCRSRRAADSPQAQRHCTCAASPTPTASAPLLPAACHPALTLTMQKEARDSTFLGSKSTKKSTDPLPDVETYRTSRSKTKSSVKMRRCCSLDYWAREADGRSGLERGGEALSVWGSAIVPEMKPRAPTMSERDLTRHYLRC